MKSTKSFRLPDRTIAQIERLTRTWDVPVSKSTVIQLAVAKLAKERIDEDIVADRDLADVI